MLRKFIFTMFIVLTFHNSTTTYFSAYFVYKSIILNIHKHEYEDKLSTISPKS